MDAFLKQLAKQDSWAPSDIKPLKGKHLKGLYELRWKSGGVQHRLIGYTSAGHEFLLLIGCTHKGKVYDPPSALQTATERKKLVQTGAATTSEYHLLSSR